MTRARPVTEDEAAALLDDPIALRDFLDIGERALLPGEPKASSLGWLDGCLVFVDYEDA